MSFTMNTELVTNSKFCSAGTSRGGPWGNFGPPSANSFSKEELMFLNSSYNYLQKT